MGILPEDVNEYLKPKSDIVIRKDKLATSVYSDTFQCCVVSVVDVVTGTVSEMKIDDETDYPESKCFRNMSAVAASMAMEILREGILVNQATVYGVIIKVDHWDHTCLLRLDCDFVKGKCTFLRCRKLLPLDFLLNAVLSVL